MPPASKSHIATGVALITATTLVISIQDVVFKTYAAHLVLWQIFALRGVFALPMLFAITARNTPAKILLRNATHRWSLLRAACLTTTFLCYYAALPFISLGTAGAGVYLAPIFVALLSARLIREPVRPLGWFAVLLGFAGVIILLRPGSEGFTPWALLPILGAVFYALAHIITRTRCQTIPGPALSLSLNGVMMLAAGIIGLAFWLFPAPAPLAQAWPYIFGHWPEMLVTDWLTLALLAAGAVAIGVMLANAYKTAPPAIIATFEYSYLIFATLWDVWIFDVTLTTPAVTGMAMIAAAGILTLRQG